MKMRGKRLGHTLRLFCLIVLPDRFGCRVSAVYRPGSICVVFK
ncbi:hypothetical protein Rumal_0178 [Ruminococcus albus 7 = DSM 20455]|uniref:Uncharacterized protein n=1 Tax=Ruminococcus albus (strain ATCC 27210 / DSM 20455 / JCM 14654 / NCDO 2250 / 7) TaxID=697329 RepID=E6UCE3_RUMA7|nr:hypothetical protein Rumal_0178 [Ruminococcus albus 7 = DSM 20455]